MQSETKMDNTFAVGKYNPEKKNHICLIYFPSCSKVVNPVG